MSKNETPQPKPETKKGNKMTWILLAVVGIALLGCINYMPRCQTACSQALPSNNTYGIRN